MNVYVLEKIITRTYWRLIAQDRMKPLTIIKMQELARSKEGECLSKTYKNNYSNIKWRCKKGHEWKAKAYNVKRGEWCARCEKDRRKLTLLEMKKIARTHNGECLSDKYINNHIHLRWRCNNNHEWSAIPANIKQGKWCPFCSGRGKTIIDMNIIANKQLGKCLSNKYINDATNLLWQCKKRHSWLATPNNIIQGHWCPLCSAYTNEKLCRKYIEKQTNFKFPKCKPLFLKGLELDGFCKGLSLAFEYNGKQHYKFTPYFHKTQQDFINQQTRDILKKQLCKKNNISLIEIPYTISNKNINNFIKNKIEEIKCIRKF